MKKAKFKGQKFDIGDVLWVRMWDQGDDEWQEGVTMIVDTENKKEFGVDIDRGVYRLQKLSGTFSTIAINADYFENPECCEVVRYGNVNKDKLLKILYK